MKWTPGGQALQLQSQLLWFLGPIMFLRTMRASPFIHLFSLIKANPKMQWKGVNVEDHANY